MLLRLFIGAFRLEIGSKAKAFHGKSAEASQEVGWEWERDGQEGRSGRLRIVCARLMPCRRLLGQNTLMKWMSWRV